MSNLLGFRAPVLLGPVGTRPEEAAEAQSFLGPTEPPSFQPQFQPAVTCLLRNQPNDTSTAHSYAGLSPLSPELVAKVPPWVCRMLEMLSTSSCRMSAFRDCLKPRDVMTFKQSPQHIPEDDFLHCHGTHRQTSE